MLRRLAVLSLALATPVLASAQSADIRGPASRVTHPGSGLAGHPDRAVHLGGMQ